MYHNISYSMGCFWFVYVNCKCALSISVCASADDALHILCIAMTMYLIAIVLVVMVWHCCSTLLSINEVNLHRAQLVLRWVTMPGLNSRCWTFMSFCNWRQQANPAFHPSSVAKWGPALAKEWKAGIVHFVGTWSWGVHIKLWDPLRMRAIPECVRGAFMTRRYTNRCLTSPYFYLY